MNALQTLSTLWQSCQLPAPSLACLELTGQEPSLPSSFAVGTAAQASIAAAAMAALELGSIRGAPAQRLSINMRDAALECTGYFNLDGIAPNIWDKFAGLYACKPASDHAWVRIHTNFAHHRDGVLKLLGLPLGPDTEREAVASALKNWSALDFESAASDAGLVVAAVRSFEQWDRHPQAAFVAAQELVKIERIGDAPPLHWPQLGEKAQALSGLKVLELTRILAGPVCGRTLASYGAQVMLVNAPSLPNIASIAETSRGKLSTHIDLTTSSGCEALTRLAREAHVFVQGYRPGGLAKLGFGAKQLAKLRPGIVCVNLSAYGDTGPWAQKRGFDSLVQTATGFNVAEAKASGSAQPKAMPVQILDYATGFLMAFGAQTALRRQALEGGSWQVSLSLARTGLWLRSLGRIEHGFQAEPASCEHLKTSYESGFGQLVALRHAAQFSETPARWTRPSMPPGSHPPQWP